jgi:serine/threonine-protein kinase
MGEVYLAEDTTLRRQVALKLLPAHLTGDRERLRRFQQEARAASALNHPNILTIHEVDQADGFHFIVTEFIEGRTLRSLLKESQLELPSLLDIVIQVASALAAAHAKGIVHRDIKPENIMVRDDGYVKVLDFGLAKLTEPETANPSSSTWVDTTPGVLVGTVQYMSPEQVRGNEIDARTDIWSLGVVIYEAVSQRPLHQARSTGDVMVSILDREPAPLTTQVPDVPAELERIVHKCLQKDPEARYQSAEELVGDLKRLKHQPEARTASTVIMDQPPPRRIWTRGHAIAAAGIVAILVCIFIAYVVLSRRSTSAHQPQIRSLVVLPLKNLSGDPGQEYFADGMTEALINDLAKIGSLRVISRTTAMQYKNSPKALPQITQELNVDFVLEGSVIRSGDSVRINIQLIQALPEEHQLWTEQYDRNLRNVMALHSDVAHSIAHELKLKLMPEDQVRSASTVNPEAYDAYLKGMFYLNQATPEGTTKGLAFLNEAVQKDPTNALPYAYLALGYATLGHGPSPPPDAFALARKQALKALEIDETIAEAHLVLAQLTMYDEKTWDWPSADLRLKRAMELNPTLAAADAHYAWYVVLFDRWDEGFAYMKRAQEVDPLAPLWPAWQGSLYWWVGRSGEAIPECQKALELNPNFPVALSVLGRAYSDTGKHDEAIAAQQKAAAINSAYLWSLGYAYARAGKRGDALRTAEEIKKTQGDRYELAVIHAALGNNEEALRSLETSYEQGKLSPWVRNLHVFANLRNDPRFQELVRKMNLPSSNTR